MDEVFTQVEIDKESAVPVKYNKNYAVIQANELVRSKQEELSILEAKLIRLAIAQILKDDTDLETYTCNATDLAKFLGITRQAIYNDTEELAHSLMKKVIYIRERDSKTGNKKKNYKMLHWVDYAEYKDGIITIKLSKHLKPYLVGLNELFVSYSYEEIIKLPTNYAIRLYELIVSFANIQFRDNPKFYYGDIPIENDEAIFSMDYLREYFNCENKYANNVDFIKRVIASAVQDINKNTIFPCSYRLIKKGKKIAFIIFKLGDWKTIEGQFVLEGFRERLKEND